ncbi:hypothetical protein HELRODRAFT_166700 [Helobdella robusta]|uniref:Uncharacterized protein n=1 Tax=Helobdella robusta TaxID=6412 RepID=T1EYE1_HELRO|nr:hypothetical protein HELRODRAFT_166700 [Helobdella robusta]ESO11685.1 hypothetical protein HELRODRAFT_166700 [Helobdella robusta]
MQLSVRLLITISLLATFVERSDEQSGSPNVTSILNNLPQSSLWYPGLSGLYDITKSYLRTIPRTGLVEKLLNGYKLSLDNVTLTDLQNAKWTETSSLVAYILSVIASNWIYVLTLVLGLLLIALMAIFNIFLTFFRSRGGFCGNTANVGSTVYDNLLLGWSYATMSVQITFIFLTAFGAMTSSRIVSDNFYHPETSTNLPYVAGVLAPVLGTFSFIENVQNQVVQSFDTAVFTKRLNDVLENFYAVIKNALAGVNKALADDLTNLNSALTSLKSYVATMKKLKVMYENFNTTLESVRAKANSLSCLSGPCNTAKTNLATLTPLSSYPISHDWDSYSAQVDSISNKYSLGTLFRFTDFSSVISPLISSLGSLQSLVKAFDLKSYLGPYQKFVNASSTEPLFANITWKTIRTILNTISMIAIIITVVTAFTLLPVVLLNALALVLGLVCRGNVDRASENIFLVYCKNDQSLFGVIYDTVGFDSTVIGNIVKTLLVPFAGAFSTLNVTNLPLFDDTFINSINSSADSLSNFPDFNSSSSTYLYTYQNLDYLVTGSGNTSLPSLLQSLSNDVQTAKANLDSLNSTDLAATLKQNLTAGLTDFFNFLKSLTADSMKCRALYDAFSFFVTSSCENISNPLNAYWLSGAMAIIFSIPTVLTGLYMGGLITRQAI